MTKFIFKTGLLQSHLDNITINYVLFHTNDYNTKIVQPLILFYVNYF